MAFIFCLLLAGCSEPPIPTEVDLAVSQDQSLWKVGVPKYAEREYGEYAAALQAGQELLLAERTKCIWFGQILILCSACPATTQPGGPPQHQPPP